MGKKSKQVKLILRNYLEQIGSNLVGALLLNEQGSLLGRIIRTDQFELKDLDQILVLVKPLVKNRINGSEEEKIKTIETDNYFLILTEVKPSLFLVSIFAIDAMIDNFLAKTMETSKELARSLEQRKKARKNRNFMDELTKRKSKDETRNSSDESISDKKVTDIPKLFLTSLVDTSRTRKEIELNFDENIEELKIKASNLFNLGMSKFHLSYEGIILDPSLMLKDYNIMTGEELVLIPARI